LESLALQHAARVAEPHVVQDCAGVSNAWRLGELIRRSLVDSPFFGADPELLSARLAAALGKWRPFAGGGLPDAMWPGRLGPIDLGELLGTIVLSRVDDRATLPSILRGTVENLARRISSSDELSAERAFWQHNALGLTQRHVSPPLSARLSLHILAAEWF